MSVESPDYEVLSKDGQFELRRYVGYLTANVRVSAADHAAATSAGFNALADTAGDYIVSFTIRPRTRRMTSLGPTILTWSWSPWTPVWSLRLGSGNGSWSARQPT